MLKLSAELWNEFYPVGTEVLYEPVRGKGNYVRARTDSEAWTLGHGEVVVKLVGRSGGCSTEHMAPIATVGRLNDLVRSFTSEDGHSLVDALFDALPADERHTFEADVEGYHEDITEMRAALREA